MAAIKYWNGSAWVYASIGAPGADGTDFAATLTTDGDLLTRSGGIATRLTRANLAADSAFANVYAPKASPTFTGNVVVPDANADGEAIAYDQANARLGSGLRLYSATPTLRISDTNGTADTREWQFETTASTLDLVSYNDLDVVNNKLIRFYSNNVHFDPLATGVRVRVPAAQMAGDAAQVSDKDDLTGRYTIGGYEIGDTGWRKVLSWTSGVQDLTDQIGVINTANFTLQGTAYFAVRRQGNVVTWRISATTLTGNTITKVNSGTSQLCTTNPMPAGFGMISTAAGPHRRRYVPIGYFNPTEPIMFGNSSTANSTGMYFDSLNGNLAIGAAASWEYSTPAVWPTALPGVAQSP